MASNELLFSHSTPLPGWINNRPFYTKATFAVLDPHDSTVVLREVHGSNVEEANQAVAAAAKAFLGWKATPISERKDIFTKAITLLEERTEEYASISLRETTIASSLAHIELGVLINRLKELVRVVDAALAEEDLPSTNFPNQTATILREPYGVVLGISPWNAPIVLSSRAVTDPIIAGNTCVLKTSELSPVSNMVISQVLKDAGLPDGVLNVVHASGEDTPGVVEAMIANPLVRKVNFTGSTRVGSIIGSLAGKYVKPVVLELGGAALFLVLDDADIEGAAKNAAFGGFMSSGQTCMCTNNILVHESVADAFVEALKKVLVNVHAGPSPDPKTHAIRGVFTTASAQRIAGLVDDAVSKGASIVVGDAISTSATGNIIQPTVVDHVTSDMRIAREEIFGPVLGIIRFKTEDEAIDIWNGLEYGLAGAIHSRDIDRAKGIARRLDTNLIHVNSFTVHDNAAVPHGGWKNSGYGRFNGFDGIREFTQTKTITVLLPEHAFAPPV